MDALLPQRLVRDLVTTDARPSGDPTGIQYRKQRQLAMVDLYPIAGFHISAGYRSWKGRLPRPEFGSANLIGRFNMQTFSPILPIQSGRSNRAPIATVGYQSRVAQNTLVGFETGVVSDHGNNWLTATSSADNRRTWSKTGALAQATLRTRFF